MKFNYQTLSQLTQRVIQRLSMFRGTSVQVYAEDRIAQMILDNYTRAFDDFEWSNLQTWYKFTLAGINGWAIENVSDFITDFDDIVCVTPDSTYRNQLKCLHGSTVPELISGTYPAYYQESANPNKIFEIIPYTSEGTIYVCSKGRLNTNGTILPETIIPFDSDYLVYAACADYLADDDSSRVQLEKFVKLRDDRMKQLKAIDNDGIIDYNDSLAYFVTSVWR